MQIGMDPLLLRLQTADGMAGSEVAARGWRIARDRRWADVAFTHTAGPACVVDGQVMAPVSLGAGVLWCGGHLLLTPLRTLPETMLEQIVGRPLRDVVDHPWIDRSIVITGLDGDTERFGVQGDAPGMTVLTTDASPIVVDVPRMTRLRHASERALNGAWSENLLLLPLYVLGVSGPMTVFSLPLAVLAGVRLHDAYILWMFMAAFMFLPMWMLAGMDADRSRGIQPRRRGESRQRFAEARLAHGL